jgi:hypothetical protein
MPGRVIIASFLLIGGALTAIAGGLDSSPVPAAAAVPPKTWDGAVCNHDNECRSHHCAVSWDGDHYCARADLSCGFPASAGVMPGFAKSNLGATYACQAGGDWLTDATRVASRKPAAPAKSYAGTATVATGERVKQPTRNPAPETTAAYYAARDRQTAPEAAPANYPVNPLFPTQTAALPPPASPFSQPMTYRSGWQIRFW